ncbi:MAG: hypothetical protein O3B31_11685 [Chloroflexi bacterium]|nr:hypothetical protein [Chloroflexota bacterium]
MPDGYTLNGNGYTITAVDPPSGGFTGAVVANAGTTAHVTNVTITASGLADSCKGGAERLRGIMLEGASGSITETTVTGINKGASGCQEGNAIEVRNAPFDGTHPATVMVTVEHNSIVDYQKTGIVANGDVNVTIAHNVLGESATQDNLAANGIQLGFGALGSAHHNEVAGNQWKGTSDFAASALLVFAAGPVDVSDNTVNGNSDIGLFIFADGGTYDHNKLADEGADHVNSGYDIGIGNYGLGNTITRNKVSGFETPLDGVEGGKNKVKPAL